MGWQFSSYTVSIFIGGIISGVLAVSAWRRRPETGTTTFALMMLAVAEWSLANALEMAATNLPTKILWAKVEYPGIVTVPVMWLCFAIQYTGRERWLTHRNLALLAITPLITLLLAWSNGVHGLIWSHIGLDTGGPFPMLALTHGAWFWVHSAYSYLVLLLGTLLFIHSLIRSPRLYRGQTGALLVGIFAPWVGNFLYLSGLNPFPHLDLTLFGFIVTGLAMTWSLFHYRMLDIIPVARSFVMEHMGDGVIVLDHQDRVVDFNPAAQALFRRTPSGVIGQPISQVLENWPDLAERCQKESFVHTEFTLPIQNKQRIFVLHVSPLRDRRGQPRGRLMVWRDITEKKQAEEAIRESEERHRSVTQSANDAIILTDSHGSIVSWNRGAQNTFGYGEEAMLGKPVVLLMPDHYKQVHHEGLKRVRSGGESHIIGETVELEGRREDGSEFPLELSLASWKAGGETFFSAIIRDITERKQAEEAQHRYAIELKAQNAELDAFAHTVAHDLKKPLTELIGFSGLLKIQLAEALDENQRRYLKRIEQSAFKMGSIVDELLLLASVRDMRKIEIGTLTMEHIVTEAQLRLEYMIKEYQAEIILPESWPVAIGYRPWVEAVWVNYISNAIKYGGQPPRVQVGAIIDEGRVRFWVRDNGDGLSPEEQARLFTSFERLHQVSVEGHGLGLSIVRRIVEKLGGQVGVESKKGQGSNFYFTLPGVEL